MTTQLETTEEFLDGILHRNPTLDWKGLKVGNEEAFILSHVNGTQSVRDLVAQSNIPLGTSIAVIRRLLAQGALIYERARTERKMSRIELALLKGRAAPKPQPILRKPAETAADVWKDVPRSGDIYAIPLPKVLWHAATHRLSGVLEVNAPEIAKKIRLAAGAAVGVESMPVVLDECLGRLFRRIGRISHAQYEESLKEMARTRRKQGQVLVEMGCLSDEELGTALRWQIEMKVLDAFSWSSGTYTFLPQRPEAARGGPAVDLVEVIFKGARRRTPFEIVKRELRQHLDSGVEIVVSMRETVEGLPMSAGDRRFVGQLAAPGGRSLREMLPTNSVARHHLVFALAVIGALRFRTRPGK
ncbi:MAG: DUF4388 domain-containing protein [Deltaproteobacteria bacterium]|nr:DUF4388 domain-containing protein [Deltaproteobacteria bacterium]